MNSYVEIAVSLVSQFELWCDILLHFLHIDGLLYNYRISCFTNITGDEKNCLVK